MNHEQPLADIERILADLASTVRVLTDHQRILGEHQIRLGEIQFQVDAKIAALADNQATIQAALQALIAQIDRFIRGQQRNGHQ